MRVVATCVLVTLFCPADPAPLSIPITAVPLTSSGFTYEQPTSDSFLVVDAVVGTPGKADGCRKSECAGNEHVVTVIDLHSKFCRAYAVADKTAVTKTKPFFRS